MITIKNKIINIVTGTITEFNLINKNDKIIIGISGGADSLSLFFILNELKEKYNLKLMLAHLNHTLRGDESDKDEQFVAELSEKYNIPLKIKRVNIPELKRKNKKFSIEEIGHHERYEFFQSLLKDNKFNKIALGHNLDDSIENFFLSSFNGGSLKSLSGIKPFENNIIRPLIKCLKKDLEQFVRKFQLPFNVDNTNKDDSYPRNWIRNKLIPYIENNYKPIKNNISNLLNILYHENNFIKNYCNQFFTDKVVFKNNFYTAVLERENGLMEHPALLRRIIQKVFEELNINYNFYMIDLIAQFIVKGGRNSIQIADDLFVWKSGKHIVMSQKKYIQNYRFNINKIPDKIIIENLNLSIIIEEMKRKDFISDDDLFAHSLFFDKSKINKIIIRQKKISDYIILMNTNFKKKLKKLFTDLKIPVPLKRIIPVIESNNEVIGIYFNIFPIFIKNRINDKYKVTVGTERIIKMEFNQLL